MALKLLQPGYLPLGQFDLEDNDAGDLLGGEYVELKQVTTPEGYAADVGGFVSGPGLRGINFARSSRTTGASPALGGLADEGTAEYGTLFGSLIGSNTGRATQFGVVGGAVVVGPSTDRASGKVTVWAQEGLYGVSGDAAVSMPTGNTTANTALYANGTTGILQTGAAGSRVAIYVSPVADSSLVSTTSTAVGAAAVTEYHAVFYLSTAMAAT